VSQFALVVVAVLARTATAEPIASTELTTHDTLPPLPPAPPPRELTAADVALSPLPGDESGRTDDLPTDSAFRRIARIALFPAHLAVDAALLPVRAAVYAQDRYHLADLYYRTFFNADHTIGLYPTVTYASGYGIDAGVRFKDTELFHQGEALVLQVTTGSVTGDTYHESARAALDTGRRLGAIQLGTDVDFERRPSDPFYGIGNANLGAAPASASDPRNDATAVSTRYRYQELRASAFGDVRIAGALHVRATGAISDQAFERSTTGPAIDGIYDPAGLVGWPGFANAYGELELRIDERRRATPWEPHDLNSEGWLAAVSLGRVHELDGGRDFWRGTVELQEFIRFAMGPRLLALRLRGEAVSGTASEVPFAELPALGGGDFLRGYDFQRFRDRVAALGSAEYVWDLAHWFDAAVFVDAGRVYSSLSTLSVDHVRIGYGAAIQFYDDRSFLFELSIASSIDGGIFLNLSLNALFNAKPRWR